MPKKKPEPKASSDGAADRTARRGVKQVLADLQNDPEMARIMEQLNELVDAQTGQRSLRKVTMDDRLTMDQLAKYGVPYVEPQD